MSGRPSPLDELAPEIERMYAEGRSQREIARAASIPLSTLRGVMSRHGITPRPRGYNVKRGPANGLWKGGAASYQAYHDRVRVRRGTPQCCETCGTTDPAKRYDWANLSGNYADPDDYARMCRSCHQRYDHARRKATGAMTSCR